jgi:hypothetical protein
MSNLFSRLDCPLAPFGETMYRACSQPPAQQYGPIADRSAALSGGWPPAAHNILAAPLDLAAVALSKGLDCQVGQRISWIGAGHRVVRARRSSVISTSLRSAACFMMMARVRSSMVIDLVHGGS